LLEACDWDEERYDFVIGALIENFSKITSEANAFYNVDTLIAEIKKRMSSISSDKEIDIIETILLEEFSDIDYQEIEYEN
tara:strand:- start:843 stop:1082 length:240 start_codon:yes stop_codon:yes gene_type:complete